MQLLRATRTLACRPQLPPFGLPRSFASKATVSTISTDPAACSHRTTFASNDMTAFRNVAHVFQTTIEGLAASHERQINALQQRLQTSNDELKKAEIALIQNIITHTYINEGLRIKLERSHNNVHLRSAIEIITASLSERQKGLGRANPAKGGSVQPVIDAIVLGDFNDPSVTFQDAQKAVLGALTAKGGIKVNDIGRALGSLYGELSKHHHTGVSEVLTLREGEQTLAEAIGAMSVILFARRLYASDFDAAYYDSTGKVQATLSAL
ncbi:hypothetical protein B0H16DRAFT_1515299 [Mycena metata]|uniref:Uncharacterized protein n=1 Tax=Mycena metata TaxID=1033252 RepID=A0AAD7JRI1_9AGAR|nr:hypothetical protein B0H16DRAFT_1515299 [Mycena metata]